MGRTRAGGVVHDLVLREGLGRRKKLKSKKAFGFLYQVLAKWFDKPPVAIAIAKRNKKWCNWCSNFTSQVQLCYICSNLDCKENFIACKCATLQRGVSMYRSLGGEGSTVKVLLPLGNLLWQQRRRLFLLEWNGRDQQDRQ